LIAISRDNCPDTAYQLIRYDNVPVYYVPNTFIPDGNGTNEIWYVVFSDPGAIKKFQVQVFDRWGELIYQSTDLTQGWDGTYLGRKAQDGTYTWKLTFSQDDYKVYEKLGHVNLLR
jgi:gliding motility-associated-like protein